MVGLCAALTALVLACGDATELPPVTSGTPGAGGSTSASGGAGGISEVGGAGGTVGGGGAGTGGCGDVLVDPKNCGFCGHDCGDASCNGGVCTRTVFDEDVTGPQDLALASGLLYWPDVFAGVFRCEAPDCAAGPETLTPVQGVTALDVADGQIYFVSLAASVIGTCSVTDCAAPLVVADEVTAVGEIHVRDDVVYFNDGADVLSCPTSGCIGAPTVLATGQQPLGIVTSSDSLYFSDRSAGTVKRCALPDCAGGPTVVTSGQPGVLGLSLVDDTLYWVNQSGGEVRRCQLADCAQTTETIAQQQEGPTNMAVDEDGIYWANFGATWGSVAGCPLAGCPPEGPHVYATKQLHPIAILTDETHIYWANVGDTGANFVGGGVYAVPK